MHFPKEIERSQIVAVDTVLHDRVKYLIFASLKKFGNYLVIIFLLDHFYYLFIAESSWLHPLGL